MNRLFTAAFLLVALAVACQADKYPERFNIDLDSILKDENQLAQYKDCLLNDGDDKCNEPGKALKRILSDAIQNDCEKCTIKQKAGAAKAIAFLTQTKPQIWQEIISKFDPAGNFAKNHPDLVS